MPQTITTLSSTVAHSECNSEGTEHVQCRNADVNWVDFYNTVCRVSALLIRWSRVRISPDPPALLNLAFAGFFYLRPAWGHSLRFTLMVLPPRRFSIPDHSSGR